MDRDVQESIVLRVTGIDPRFTGRFRNPFREDKNPSCFWQWYNGYLRLVDNSDRRYFNYNCWDMVMEKHNCDFKEAKKLVSSWNMGMPTKVQTPEDNFEPHVEWTTRAWNSRDAAYWGQYGIRIMQLESDEVQPIKHYRFNSRRFPTKYFNHFPAQAYAIPAKDKIKIYAPYEDPKFITNSKNNDLFFTGYPISDVLFIASSYKDGRVLMNLGLSVRGLQGETMIPDEHIINAMTKKATVYVALDGDEAGIENTKRFVKEMPNVKPFFFPEELRKYGKDYAEVRANIVNPYEMKKIIYGLL